MFFAIEYSYILSRQGGGGGVYEILFGDKGFGWISGGTRVLELAADNREAALGQGVIYQSSNHVTFASPLGRGSKLRKTEEGRSRKSDTD
jgi:hypothetical protein